MQRLFGDSLAILTPAFWPQLITSRWRFSLAYLGQASNWGLIHRQSAEDRGSDSSPATLTLASLACPQDFRKSLPTLTQTCLKRGFYTSGCRETQAPLFLEEKQVEVDFWEEDIILPHLSSYTEQTHALGQG